jgi:hypothetical protein
MSAGRILGLLIAVGIVVWLVRSSGFLGRTAPEAGISTPVEKARAAARASDARSAQAEAASHDPSGSVTENMTPEQVRSLLGAPDSVDSETAGDGTARERWTYRQAGKTVVFENGVVVRVE